MLSSKINSIILQSSKIYSIISGSEHGGRHAHFRDLLGSKSERKSEAPVHSGASYRLLDTIIWCPVICISVPHVAKLLIRSRVPWADAQGPRTVDDPWIHHGSVVPVRVSCTDGRRTSRQVCIEHPCLLASTPGRNGQDPGELQDPETKVFIFEPRSRGFWVGFKAEMAEVVSLFHIPL